jgi:arsenate reductase (thioredoxin)
MNRTHTILFLCQHSSARDQMVEGLARKLFGARLVVLSAGHETAEPHPLALAVMHEAGVDLTPSPMPAPTLDPTTVGAVILLDAEDTCPASMAHARRLRWSIPDPESLDPSASPEERITRFRAARDQIQARLDVMLALLDLPPGPEAQEFHASVRVKDLARSTRFYAWLLGAEPREWTHRYSTFVRPELRTNFVLLVSDGKELHHDTLYHLGIAVHDKAAVIRTHELALAAGLTVTKPPRTTWRGTPLHELWLEDPDGNLVEVYARLTPDELSAKPENLDPVALTCPTCAST